MASTLAEGPYPRSHRHSLVPCRLVLFSVAGLPRLFPLSLPYFPIGVMRLAAQQLSSIVASSRVSTCFKAQLLGTH